MAPVKLIWAFRAGEAEGASEIARGRRKERGGGGSEGTRGGGGSEGSACGPGKAAVEEMEGGDGGTRPFRRALVKLPGAH